MAVIVAVRNREGSPVCAWHPGGLYVVLDTSPQIELCVTGQSAPALAVIPRHLKGLRKQKFEGLEEDRQAGGRWWRLSLATLLSEQRRVGRLTLEFDNPKRVAVHCYVIPERLLDVATFRAMSVEVEQELQRPVTWRRRDPFGGSAWSVPVGGPGALTEERLDSVESELACAAQVRRQPIVELSASVRSPSIDRAIRSVESPENAVVTHWAARRLADLARWRQDVIDEARLVSTRLQEAKATPRHTVLDDELKVVTAARERLERLTARVGSFVRDSELHLPISVGPLVQRDHRLRRLLSAFVPERTRRPTEQPEDLSAYPPVILNDLFELWGAVWIVRCLHRLGFSGRPTISGQQVESVSWRLTRGPDEVLWVHFKPDPVRLDDAAAPPAHERAQTAEEWAAARLVLDPERPFYGTRDECSPDYLICLHVGDRRTLLVGDACLADPRYQDGEKALKVTRYAATVRWMPTTGITVGCASMGTFLLLQGPQSAWVHAEAVEHARDVTVLAPLLPAGDPAAEERLRALLRRFLSVAPDLTASESRFGGAMEG